MILYRSLLLLSLTTTFVHASTPAELDQDFNDGSGYRRISFDLGGSLEDRAAALRVDTHGNLIVVGTARQWSTTTRAVMSRVSPTGNNHTDLILTDGFVGTARGVTIGPADACVAGYAPFPGGGPWERSVVQCVRDGAASSMLIGGPQQVTGFNSVTPVLGAPGEEFFLAVGYVGEGDQRDSLVQAIKLSSAPGAPPALLTSLNFSPGLSDAANDVIPSTTNGYYVLGTVLRSGSDNDFYLLKLTPEGEADVTAFPDDYGEASAIRYISFDKGSTDSDRAVAAAEDSDGNIIVVGTANMDQPQDFDIAVAKISPAGELLWKRTHTFESEVPAQGLRDEVGGMVVDEQGRIYVVGTLNTGIVENASDIALTRMLPNGDIDTSFGVNGRRLYNFSNAWSQSDTGVDLILVDDGVVILGDTQSSPESSLDTDLVLFKVSLAESDDTLFRDSFEGYPSQE